MTRPTLCPLATLLGVAMLSGGCRSGGFVLLNLLTGAKPITVALVSEQPLETLALFTPYEPLRLAMEKHVGRPVVLDLCLPFQLELGLATGFYQFAFVSPTTFARLSSRDACTVLAVPADLRGRTDRSGLLVVKANSDVKRIADLSGKLIAFGPQTDARLHYAAVDLLEHGGLPAAELRRELLPLPGLKHLPHSRAVAQSVIAMSSDAGFIDEAYWEAIPATTAAEGEPARDGLRVIAKTGPMPDTLLIAAPSTDADTIANVRAFALACATAHPEALAPIKASAYAPAEPASLAAWVQRAGRRDESPTREPAPQSPPDEAAADRPDSPGPRP